MLIIREDVYLMHTQLEHYLNLTELYSRVLSCMAGLLCPASNQNVQLSRYCFLYYEHWQVWFFPNRENI